MPTKNYDIHLRYVVDDRAVRGMGNLRQEAVGVAQANRDVLGSLKGIAAALGAGALVAKGKAVFIDFNANVQKTQIGMAAMLKMNRQGLGFNEALGQATTLYGQLQQDAKASVGETEDFLNMAARIEGPLLRAGASMRDLREITKGATIAAQLMPGMDPELAGLDIEQALAGTLAKKDRFARALIEPAGYTTESWNALVKKGPAKALAELKKLFNQPAILEAAKAMEGSFSGVTSTLTDNLKLGLGKIGLPLFKEITAEVKRWNEWIDKNPEKIEEFSTTFATALRDGFEAARAAAGFIVEHKDVLIKLAEAYALAKVAGLSGGGGLASGASGGRLGSIGANLGALFVGQQQSRLGLVEGGFPGQKQWIQGRSPLGGLIAAQKQAMKEAAPTIGQVIGGAMTGYMAATFTGANAWQKDISAGLGAIGSLPGPVGLAANALLALQTGAQALADYLLGVQLEKRGQSETLESYSAMYQRNQGNINDLPAQMAQRRLLESNMFSEDYDASAVAAALDANRRNIANSVIDEVTKARNEGLITAGGQFDVAAFQAKVSPFWDPAKVALVTEDFVRAVDAMKEVNPNFFNKADEKKPGDDVHNKKAASVTVNIQRIEVSAKDPGRFVFGIAEIAEKAARKPTQPRRTRRGV